VWPGFDTLDHTRTIALYVLSASVLAAAGLDRISEMPGRLRNILYFCIGIAAALILVTVLLHAAPLILDVPAHIKNQAETHTNPNFSSQFFADAGNKIEASFSSTAAILYLPVLLQRDLFYYHCCSNGKWSAWRFNGILAIADRSCIMGGPIRLVYTERKDLYPESSKRWNSFDPDKFRVYDCNGRNRCLNSIGKLQHARLPAKSSIRFSISVQ
jgi:hypothetical protein